MELGCESQTPLKRFVKKIPASGASSSAGASLSAWKLTLPHSIVRGHLQHLINTDFEICSREDEHSWQASIIPRRNKDRSEYTLQGWKLWAEAHSIQSGDQVSFELVHPRKMILTVIKRESEQLHRANSEKVRKTSRREACADPHSPMKSFKSSASTSPSNSPLPAHKLPEIGALQFDQSLEPEGFNMAWGSLVGEEPVGLENFSSALEDAEALGTNPDPVKAEDASLEARSFNEPFTELELNEHAFIGSSRNHNRNQEPGLFLAHSPGLSSSANVSSHDLKHLGSIFDSELQEPYPRQQIPLRRNRTIQCLLSGTSSAADEFSEVRHEYGPVIQTSDRASGSTAFARRWDDMNAGWKSFQTRLDRETRTAMRAAMGLEKCIIRLTAEPTADRTAQEEMFRNLSILKANLWQMLVMSMPEDKA